MTIPKKTLCRRIYCIPHKLRNSDGFVGIVFDFPPNVYPSIKLESDVLFKLYTGEFIMEKKTALENSIADVLEKLRKAGYFESTIRNYEKVYRRLLRSAAFMQTGTLSHALTGYYVNDSVSLKTGQYCHSRKLERLSRQCIFSDNSPRFPYPICVAVSNKCAVARTGKYLQKNCSNSKDCRP